MIVGIVVVELHVPGARSLKEKRRVIKSLIERLHRRHRISIAETAHHDLHQRAEIGVAVVGSRDSDVERLLDDLRRAFDESPELLVTHWSQELIEESQP